MIEVYRDYWIVELAGPLYDVYDHSYMRLVRFTSNTTARSWIDTRIDKRGIVA